MFFRSILRKSKIFRRDHLLRIAGGDGEMGRWGDGELCRLNCLVLSSSRLEWNARPLCAVIILKLR
jgi:hypothetical protein